MPISDARPRALIVDWAGVLTRDVRASMAEWTRRDGIVLSSFQQAMIDWSRPAGAHPDSGSPLHELELGRLGAADFERLFAARLRTVDGGPVAPEGLLAHLGDALTLCPSMVELVRAARASGLRTALVSNSWGTPYPHDVLAGLFDAVVISSEVGMRKPGPRIFHHTLRLLGCRAADAVLVDDQEVNVRGALGVGMLAVWHRSTQETRARLEEIFPTTFS